MEFMEYVIKNTFKICFKILAPIFDLKRVYFYQNIVDCVIK